MRHVRKTLYNDFRTQLDPHQAEAKLNVSATKKSHVGFKERLSTGKIPNQINLKTGENVPH